MPPTTNTALRDALWRAHDALVRDDNTGVVFRIEHLAWPVYLRCLDRATSILRGPLAWDAWAGADALAARSDGELLAFVREGLIPGLASLTDTPLARMVAALFSDETIAGARGPRTLAVCASAANLRLLIATVDALDPTKAADRAAAIQFFEELLARSIAQSPILGEFYTPRPLVRFMVDLLDIQPGETVYDPAYGSAGLLAQALDAASPRAVFGLEQKAFPALLGATLLALRGSFTPHLARGNTLNAPLHCGRRADVILSNPYFADIGQANAPSHFAVRSGATDLLFVQHIMARLKRRPGARAAVVVPEGFLFRGDAFAAVKRALLDTFHLTGLIGLPTGAFAPFSDLKTAILVFERPATAAPAPDRLTWCCALTPPKELRPTKTRPLADAHVDEARSGWRAWQIMRVGAGMALAPRADAHTTMWLEPAATFEGRGFDLRLAPPTEPADQPREPAAAIVARLVENSQRCRERIESLHRKLGGDA